jgi:hypothetical protein
MEPANVPDGINAPNWESSVAGPRRHGAADEGDDLPAVDAKPHRHGCRVNGSREEHPEHSGGGVLQPSTRTRRSWLQHTIGIAEFSCHDAVIH